MQKQERSFWRRARWPLAAAVFAVLAVTTTSALAGSGVGGVFNLGVPNDVNGTTNLHGTTAGAQLLINNASTSAGSYAIAANGNSSTPAISGGNTVGPGFRGISGPNTGAIGVSTSGIGTEGRTASASSPALRGINTGGGPAGAFQVNAGVTPFTVNSNTLVTDLNADLLDGVHANELGRKESFHFDFPATPAPGTAIASVPITTTQTNELLDISFDMYTYSTDPAAADYPCQPSFYLQVDGSFTGDFAISTLSVPPQPGGNVFGGASAASQLTVSPGAHTVEAIYYGEANGFFGGTPPCNAGLIMGRGTLIARSSLFHGDGSHAKPAARVKAKATTAK